jgi:sugar lactone lactonase YvrE
MTRFSVARPAAIAVLAAAAACAQSPTINDLPSREFGQPILVNPLVSNAPNLVEGRELYSPSEMAFDVFSGILYVADTRNNRVLAWKNPQGLAKGNPADLVIGQRDLMSTSPQGPTSNQPNGFTNPASVAVDNVGSLYVLDASNNRILRFPAPFRQSGGFLQWDLVIGQKSINSGGSPNEGGTVSAATLNLQFGGGMAFDSQFNLWVADAGNNRVLRFPNAVLIPNAVSRRPTLFWGRETPIASAPIPSPAAAPPLRPSTSVVFPARRIWPSIRSSRRACTCPTV